MTIRKHTDQCEGYGWADHGAECIHCTFKPERAVIALIAGSATLLNIVSDLFDNKDTAWRMRHQSLGSRANDPGIDS
jgi:hypothetical protein